LTAQVLVPPSAVREAFEKQVITLRDLIASNEAESQILADLRDTLLSKLISDDIRAPTDEGSNNDG
jgi:type I restriction enzyme S subunit